MTNTQLTYLRTAATVVVTGLAALVPEFPSYTWIPAIIAVFATVGIHAIPAVGQVAQKAITPEVKVMSEQPTAAQLMGIAPVTPPITAQKTDAVDPSQVAPVTETVDTGVAQKSESGPVPVPAAEPVSAAPDVDTAPVVAPDGTTAQKSSVTLTDPVPAAQPVLTDDEIATLRKILDKLS